MKLFRKQIKSIVSWRGQFKEERLKRGLSLGTIARGIGKSTMYISEIERGSKNCPKTTAKAIEKFILSSGVQ